MRFARRWSRQTTPEPAKTGQAPRVGDGQRVYAIGDIHGRADLLTRIRELIAEDLQRSPASDACIVLLGDYVDRGPDSKGVLDQLTTVSFPARLVALRGNHEAMLLEFLDRPQTGELWLRNGGIETLYSYGVECDRRRLGTGFSEAADRFRAALPEAHMAFLRRLPSSLAIGDYFFCHAGVRPGVPLDDQSEQDLIWIRGEFLASQADFGKVVVHGHNAAVAPEIRSNRISVDTGAYITHVLTCLVLQGPEHRFLQTEGNPVGRMSAGYS